MDFRYSKQQYGCEKLLTLEWLDTNGIGGYASSTILGCNTRKYHGLLVSKLTGMPDKYVLLSKLDDVLVLSGQEYLLTAHQYAGSDQYAAYNHFYEFVLDTHPQIVYRISDDVYLTKEILSINDEDTVLIKYKLVGNNSAQIKVRPLFAYRNFHALSHENSFALTQIVSHNDNFKIAPYDGMPECFIKNTTGADFASNAVWYRNFIYRREQERGYVANEDLFSPGFVDLSFADNTEVFIAFSLNEITQNLDIIWNEEIRRRRDCAKHYTGSALQQQLKKTALTFLQKNLVDDSRSLVAGYHWFLEWGRDAMIALPGLTLYSGLEQECLAVLNEFARHTKDGLIPNFIGNDEATTAYNSVDASLWFAWAMQQYYNKTKDAKAIATHLWPTLKDIFTHFKEGTLHNIKMQEDGLLYAGSREVNLTWMDAMVYGKPVTPRYGLQVEVNALWFNMLCFMHELAVVFLDPIKYEIAQLLPKIRLNFCQTFYAEEDGYLYDFVNNDEKNLGFRPNQIFAVSLPYSPLPKKIALKVVEKVQQQLLTPYGLRTLTPLDQNYRGVYFGRQEERDYAYHNGTVWPWLLGHFAEALLKVYSRKCAIEILQPSLVALKAHLHEGCIGSIAEIFSGDAPHAANGCISQAWSVAEVLRLTYLLNAKPSDF